MTQSILAANLGHELLLSLLFAPGAIDTGFAGIRENAQTIDLAGTDTTIILSGTPSSGQVRLFNSILRVDPNGSGTKLILPAVADLKGYRLSIYNSAGAAETLLIRDSGDSTTVVSLDQGESGVVWSDGTSYGAVGGSTGSDFGASGISADIIAESTAAAGVTVDGLLIKDGAVDLNGVADALILDADADTTISAPTDDQIDIEVGGSDVATITATALALTQGMLLDLQGGADALVLDDDGDTTISAPTDDQIDFEVGGADVARLVAAGLQVDAITEITGDAGVGIEGVLIKDNSIEVPDSGLVTLQGAADTTGQVVARLGGSATEGLELVVYEDTVTPSAIETNLINVPANSRIVSVQSNVESALTGGGTTVTYGIGTTGDGDKYGTPASDALTQNTKTDFMGDGSVLSSAEQMVLTGLATGGGSDGDTALTVGSVRVRVVYWTVNSLDNA